MPPLLAAAARAKAAQKHLRRAQELEARWSQLTPEQQEVVRGEWAAVRRAAAQVQFKLSYGMRGFVHEFKAAKDGREPEPIDKGQPLAIGVKELGRALASFRTALDRMDAGSAAPE